MSIPYHLGALFGAITPAFASIIIRVTGCFYVWLVYPVVVAMGTIVVIVFWVEETYKVDIESVRGDDCN
jgi:hypothetical protein